MNKIYEVKTYNDKSGRVVSKFESEDGSVEFYGSAMVKFNDGNAPINFQFPDTVKTPEDCYESFDEIASAYINSQIQANQQNDNSESNEVNESSPDVTNEEDGVIKFPEL